MTQNTLLTVHAVSKNGELRPKNGPSKEQELQFGKTRPRIYPRVITRIFHADFPSPSFRADCEQMRN